MIGRLAGGGDAVSRSSNSLFKEPGGSTPHFDFREMVDRARSKKGLGGER